MKYSKKGYTKEQMDEGVKLYCERPDLRVSDIAKRIGVTDPSTISHWVSERGLPLRVSKSTGWKKNSSSNQPSKKMVTCPSCGKRYKPMPGQKFCHLCGTDITPLDERCKTQLIDIYLFINTNLANPHVLSHPDLVTVVKELINKFNAAQADLTEYFNK